MSKPASLPGQHGITRAGLRPFLDASVVEWACTECGAITRLKLDPEPAFRHRALYCPKVDDEQAIEATKHWQDVIRMGAEQRAALAHLMKHPEHIDAERIVTTADQAREISRLVPRG